MVRPERRTALRDAIADLLRYRTGLTEAAFLAARDTQRMVLHAMYVAIQAALDDALELCKERGIEPGPRYRDAFLALGRAGLLDAELAKRLADWASFRNVLAHFYPIVDLSRVFAALAELDDLERFARWIDGGASGA